MGDLTIKELVVYVPSRDFELSKRFYSALNFELTDGWGGTIDCRLGGVVFRLQDYYVKAWAENFMMKFDIVGINAWHAHVKDIIEKESYGDARVDDRIESIGDTRIFHAWDPSGVLLIFVQ